MTVQTHEASMISAHAAHVGTEATAMGEISEKLAHDGVGPLEMYGILVGQLVQRILESAANSKASAITNLSDVLASTEDTLKSAAQTYLDGEQTAAEHSRAIETDIDQIDVPR